MPIDTTALKELADAASPGPWRAMRNGNQYLDVELDQRRGKDMISPKGRVTLVGASIVEGLQRPWNPWWCGDSTSPATQETVRLKDADADFVAAARYAVPALCDEVERLRAEVERYKRLAHGLSSDGGRGG